MDLLTDQAQQILVSMYEAGSNPTQPDPSLTELGAVIGVNRQTAFYHVQRLRDAGLVVLSEKGKRALSIEGVKVAKRIQRGANS